MEGLLYAQTDTDVAGYSNHRKVVLLENLFEEDGWKLVENVLLSNGKDALQQLIEGSSKDEFNRRRLWVVKAVFSLLDDIKNRGILEREIIK